MKTFPYYLFLILSGLFTLGALVTLWPWGAADWPNLLGYKSLCPFAPAASLVCGFGALVSCTVRARFFHPQRYRKSWVPNVVLAVILLGGAGAWVPGYLHAKAPQAVTGASPQ